MPTVSIPTDSGYKPQSIKPVAVIAKYLSLWHYATFTMLALPVFWQCITSS